MSALSILGGIGKGVMMGQQETDRRNMAESAIRSQESNNAINAERLSLAKEEAAARREEREYQKATRARLAAEQQAYRDIYSRTDMNDLQKSEEYAKYVAQNGTPEEHQVALKNYDALYARFGSDAIGAARMGDFSKVQSILEKQAPGSRVLQSGSDVVFMKPDGSKQKIDMEGLAQFLSLGDELKRMQAAREAEAKIGKLGAEAQQARAAAGASSAHAGLYAAQAQGERDQNAVPVRERLALTHPNSGAGTSKQDVEINRAADWARENLKLGDTQMSNISPKETALRQQIHANFTDLATQDIRAGKALNYSELMRRAKEGAQPPVSAGKSGANFETGKVYVDGKGNRAKYLGNGEWSPL